MKVVDIATSIAINTLPMLALVLLAMLAERRKPVERPALAAARLNLPYLLVYGSSGPLTSMALGSLTVAAVNMAGGGWISLRADGWRLLPSFLAYLLVLDLLEYLFHRAQHRFAWLWAMHSLHHSDPAMNASTVVRHFWLEPALKALTIYLLAGLLFATPGVILGMYAVLGFYHIVPHMNLRLGFGRGWWLLNSPQFHRIHHSALPQHYNCNFASLFPAFDLLFRTHHVPQPGEFPPTGLDQAPTTLWQALSWPFRYRQPAGEASAPAPSSNPAVRNTSK